MRIIFKMLGVLAILGLCCSAEAFDCSGLSNYVGGTTYATGNQVKNVNHGYRCDVGGWCTIGGAYEPGVGWAWTNAWTDLGACATTTTSSSSSSASIPAGYTFCANENAVCSFSGTASVAYGANGAYNYQTATTSISCNNTVFGDPISGVQKSCYYKIIPPGNDTNTLLSPNSSIQITVQRNSSGSLSFAVTKNGATVIENSAVGINTNLGNFNTGLTFTSRTNTTINESYSLPGHKKATYDNRANEMLLRFSKSNQEFDLVVRAYDDGIAYRYRIPGSGALTVSGEDSYFNLPDSASGWAQNFNSSYEGFYPAVGNFKGGTYGFPLLASVSGQWVLLSESDIVGNYHSTHLTGGSGNNLKVAWPTTASVNSTRTFNSPWRLAIIGSLANIVESTLVENLATPSAISNTQWIVPGKASWSWHAGATQSDYNAHLGFIDFASSLGWPYYLVDDGWQTSWIQTLISYASARNVGIWLWVNDEDVKTETQMRNKFSQWAGWGVKGVKVDFFDDDNQTTMQLYDNLARIAAEYQLMINFHGSTKPNGLLRKWPNILSREAVFGAEQGNLDARHNISLVFTRNVIGPMDYTPVFYVDSGGNTTWAHQTALSVVFSSYVQHFSDHWDSYKSSIAKTFLSKVPTIWDETRLLEGQPDQYATVARRAGSEWYVGTLAVGARTAPISLSFLTSGLTYTAHIYRDGTSNSDITYETRTVTSADSLNLALRTNGGAVVRITSQSTPMITGKYYKIINRNSGKALVIENASLGDGSKAVQWTYENPTTNDEWRLVDEGGGYSAIINRNSGKTLDVSNGATNGGATILQTGSRGTTHEQWQLVDAGGGYYNIRNRNSGLILDVSGADVNNGAPVIQWQSHNDLNQQWQLIEVGNIP